MLLCVFTLNTLPREFIHEFANHHDAHDTVHRAGELSISEHHRHCDFLQIGVEPYLGISVNYFAPVQVLSWLFLSPETHAKEFKSPRNIPPRAPPVALAATIS